MSNIIIY